MTTTPKTRGPIRIGLAALLLLLTLTAIVVSATGSHSAAGERHAQPSPVAGITTLRNGPTSTYVGPNWGGYITAQTPAYSVSTTFVAPQISCAKTEYSAAGFWAGIDGYGGSTVEQDGITALCDFGSTGYQVWTEVFPLPEVVISSVTVHPGDTITATVTYVGNNTYNFVITDATNGTSSNTNTQATGPERNSGGECIAEDPGYPNQYPYAWYPPVQFTNCTVNGQPIGNFSNVQVSTYNPYDPAHGVDAVAGPLVNGNSFTVSRVGPGYVPPPVVGMSTTSPTCKLSCGGYYITDTHGDLFSFGNFQPLGSLRASTLARPIVGIVATPDNKGYWMVASDGGVFSFGDAGFYGSTGAINLTKPIVGMTPTADGKGYWLVASDGGIFAFGDAGFYGSTGAMILNRPVVGMATTPDGRGYWLVASDGGIFSFGDAQFYGSTGAMILNRPVVGMASDGSGHGYWLVASDGGIFSFGDAPFYGSTGNITLNQPIVGMAADTVQTSGGSRKTGGYWMVASDGGIFSFGSAPFLGSVPSS